MLVKDEVLLEALKAAQHEPPKTPRVVEKPDARALAAVGTETQCEVDAADVAATLKVVPQGRLDI